MAGTTGHRRRKGKPYDPAAPKIHDRRATDTNRGIAGHMAPLEVDDPYEAGGKIISMRSTRNDPLGDHHARGTISESQYQAGRAFQQDFETAERGPRAIEPREWVDGGQFPEPLTEGQRKAVQRLSTIHRRLGIEGSAIVHRVLVLNHTMKQVAAANNLSGRASR
jgi:hypothetical protein